MQRFAHQVWRVLTLRWWGDDEDAQLGAALVLFALLFAFSVLAFDAAAVVAASR